MKITRNRGIGWFESIRPALFIQRNEMRNLQLDRLEELDSARSTHHDRISQELSTLATAAAACREHRRLAVAHFKVEIERASVGDGTLGHAQAHARVGRLERAAVAVEYAIGARDYRTIRVGVERELLVRAVVVVVSRVG